MIRELELVEAGTSALSGAAIDRDGRIIKNVVMINSVSANGQSGRTYTPAALAKIASLAEGLPAYANHVKDKADAFKPRDVRDVIGRHRNVTYDPVRQRVTSDLHIMPHHSWVMNVAETMGDTVGASVVCRGVVRVDDSGKEHVEDVVQLRSCDLVTDPATTRGLFEHREEEPVNRIQKAKTAIAAHTLGQRYGVIRECVSDVFITSLVESAEEKWATLLDERVALLDSATSPRTTTTVTQEGSTAMLDNPHARLAAALEGRRYFDYSTMRPTAKELAEQQQREERLRPVKIPEGAHRLLAEALGADHVADIPAGAHERLARIINGGRR